MSENSYVNYQEMISSVNTSVVNLKKICSKLELQEHAAALDAVNTRLKNHVFRVGIMGEFKRGKSTVINALLGQNVVPADILPCSATLNRIVWDATPRARINFKKDENGTQRPSKDVPVEELSSYVTKLTTDSAEQAGQVEDAVVYYPCKFCQNGVEIIDTPGLNDDERMDAVSESVIPTLDAIIMVVVPGSPFSISEANFVRNKIMTSDLSRLIFVVNKIDTIRERDRKRCVDGIRSKIEETILDKTASIYGKDSAEYASTKSKLGGIRIYPISAADALDGKLEGDEELLNGSGMPEFEDALTKLLTEERGMLELMPTVSTIISKLKEADASIVMRHNAMIMETDKFEQLQKEALQKIEQSRNEKKQKVKQIKGIAASMYQELQPMVVESYNALEAAVTNYVDNYPISSAKMENEAAVQAFQQEISDGISRQFETSLQESTEKMQVRIQERLGQEVNDLQVYNRALSAQLDDIRCMVPSVKAPMKAGGSKFDKVDALAMGVEAVTNFTNIVPGLGGAISGFKDHGVVGGIVGFGSGFVMTHLAANAAATVAVALLGSAAMSAVVPITIIAGIAGAFGGKKITDGVFRLFKGKQAQPKQAAVKRSLSEKDILTIRNGLKDSGKESINKLRAEHTLENWLKSVTDETFFTLSAKLDQETEEALQGLQETLTNIRIDLNNGKAHQQAVLEKLDGYHQELETIAQTIAPVKSRLDEVLAGSPA